jgi:molybdopterin converting factor small subunit
MITVTIDLFGAFRRYEATSSIAVTLAPEATLADVRSALAERWPADAVALLASAAFADDHRIHAEHEAFRGDVRVAILPPVCGG